MSDICVVNVSGGSGSILAAHRAVARYGVAHCRFVFADTNCEDPSLYAALQHLKQTFPAVPFTILSNSGKTIWDVFNKESAIKTNGSCKASVELKQKPLARFHKRLIKLGLPIVIATGLDYSEPERRERFDKKMQPLKTWHPMCDRPVLSFCEQNNEMRRLGYPEQALYERGYPHNNCGGGCVLAGLSQWAGLLTDKPELFAWHEEREAQFNANLVSKGREPFTVLRDRRGGVSKNMTLKEFRERVEQEGTSGLRDFRSTCGCMTMEDTDATTND